MQISEADIRQFMPPDMKYVSFQPPVQQEPATAAATSEAGRSQAAVQQRDAPSDIRTNAACKAKELDAKLNEQEQESKKRADARVVEYNASVKEACRNALP